ncbi:MAG TPA: ribulose-phosphate 3-epimerase, partial [Bacteroidetes bacterium]|nr:ribulose-phosphate 3-epimerase [Bacteroidota bacterium]HEX04543.1 ribulose-phosphate 3-epimerase [Bacteroidota bacterium]
MNQISPHPVRILPSLLAADFANLGPDAKRALDAGAYGLHADIMDGQFVPPITYGADVVKAIINVTGAWVDAHLMIEDPDKQVLAFASAGAKAITIHAEATPHLHRVLGMIRDAGCEAGVALNPATPVTATLQHVMPLLDRVLIMTVNPGWGGQKFIHEGLGKVSEVAQLLRSFNSMARLQVDGGVTPDNAAELIRHGADELVAGSAI